MPASRARKDDSSNSPTNDDIKDSNYSELGKVKRKRQSQSCDACRARKVRCARENADDPHGSCKHCLSLGVPCTYDYQPKKRGPPNLYLRRLQEAAAAAAVQPDDSQYSQRNVPSSRSSPTPQSTPVAAGNFTPSSSDTGSYLGHSGSTPLSTNLFAHSVSPATSAGPISSARYAIAADSFQSPHPPAISTSVNYVDSRLSDPLSCGSPPVTNGRPSTASTVSSNHSGSHTQHICLPSNGSSQHASYNLSYSLKHTPPDAQPHGPLPPPLSYYVRSYRLEDVAPRDIMLLIISLFFDFIYPLTPCIHKPSFMVDLQSRREERDPLFFALVMSTVASTCVQVPRSFLPMSRREVRKLAQTCYEASRHISVAGFDPPTTTHVVIRYFDTIYHFCEGHDATSHASFGEAVHIAITLRMHEEVAYDGLDPIDSEIRRRVFWLLHNTDKSMSLLLGRPMCLRDEDCNLNYSKEVDDEYITPNGILPQPHGKTAIISGLNYISRIFSLLGETLVRIRADKRSPPEGHLATAWIEEIRSLHHRILTVLSHVPPPLQLKGYASGSSTSYDNGFTKATFAKVKDFFDNPNASRANASNAFLVMQANIYVTQQLVRFVIEQYGDERMTSIRGAMGHPADPEPTMQQDREAVASDLLNILHSIPIQSIATNGPSLVHKVRFVASTLLDTVQNVETAPDSAARAHAYLWNFLSILSEIERNYLLDDDQDAPSNGDRVQP